jgi:hypothetical protein
MKRSGVVGALCVCLTAGVLGWAPSVGATDGFIHGTVTTSSGNTYTGLLRWGNEEAFWDDLFHSSKVELPYISYADEAEDRGERRQRWWHALGRELKASVSDGSSRLFIARFGDIARIEVTGSDRAEVTMKGGTTVAVDGYSNDVGGTITVRDPAVGEIEVPWKKIDSIVFSATPDTVEPEGFRLQGTVTTSSGEFDGFIQWDVQECLSFDELDGDSEDGRLAIQMGTIHSIERRSGRSSTVVLKDGRTLVLDGTNDVNSSNRGIMVEDHRYGRVKIPWREFERLELREPQGSGRAYDDYAEGSPLRAVVVDSGGTRHQGRIAFDLDETESWEMLNGSADDIEYNIPFERIAAVEPRGRSAATVLLRTGEELRLEDGQDVTDSNDGVVVIQVEASGPHYIPWDEISRIELEWVGE